MGGGGGWRLEEGVERVCGRGALSGCVGVEGETWLGGWGRG